MKKVSTTNAIFTLFFYSTIFIAICVFEIIMGVLGMLDLPIWLLTDKTPFNSFKERVELWASIKLEEIS